MVVRPRNGSAASQTHHVSMDIHRKSAMFHRSCRYTKASSRPSWPRLHRCAGEREVLTVQLHYRHEINSRRPRVEIGHVDKHVIMRPFTAQSVTRRRHENIHVPVADGIGTPSSSIIDSQERLYDSRCCSCVCGSSRTCAALHGQPSVTKQYPLI